MKKLLRWFGDETSQEEESESTDSEWDTVQRKKHNKEKRKKRKAAMNEIEENTYEKANHIIGFGPINESEIDKFRQMDIDYEAAKRMAIEDLLIRKSEIRKERS